MGGVRREPESEGQDDAEAWKEEVARGREHDLALPDPFVKWDGCQNVTRLLWTCSLTPATFPKHCALLLFF